MSESHFFTDKKTQFSQNHSFLTENILPDKRSIISQWKKNEAKYFILSMVQINVVWSAKPG